MGLDPSVRVKMPKIWAEGSSRPIAAGHDSHLTGCLIHCPSQAFRGELQRAQSRRSRQRRDYVDKPTRNLDVRVPAGDRSRSLGPVKHWNLQCG